jgi:hypothetical protein
LLSLFFCYPFYFSTFEFVSFVSRILIRESHLRFCLCITFNWVAHVKSTTRPMTLEELAAAGLPPAEEEIQEAEIAQLPEDNPAPAASESENCEDGEIRSEGEDIGDVDADLKDLVAAKRSKSLSPSFVFGESKVTTNLIREYEAAGFFPAGDGRDPLDEQVPTPEADEVVVFRDFFTCGCRFPCDPLLPAILDKFSVKIHQLSLSSFLELSKFFWVMKTFGCNFGADVFHDCSS